VALSFPLNLPTVTIPTHVIFRAHSAVGASVSPFTAEQQLYVHQGEWWEADFDLPPMERADAEEWVGFLLALNGQEGTFLMGDPANTSPRGAASGTPLVNGGSQTGKTLLTKGWTTTVTNIMRAGDWLQLGTGSGTHLHKVVQSANSDGAGLATLEIWPRLRASPTNEATITIASTKGLWRLASNMREWSIEGASLYGVAFSCREAL
jgi:hypothetical protein